MEINRIQLKALLLSVITECKFGQPLTQNAKVVKNQFKKMAGLKSNCSNTQLLNAIGFVYRDNKLENEFRATIDKFQAEKYL
jgi:hypothetical protein